MRAAVWETVPQIALRNCSKEAAGRDFPGGPLVKTSPSNVGGAGLIPGRGTKISHASWSKTKT